MAEQQPQRDPSHTPVSSTAPTAPPPPAADVPLAVDDLSHLYDQDSTVNGPPAIPNDDLRYPRHLIHHHHHFVHHSNSPPPPYYDRSPTHTPDSQSMSRPARLSSIEQPARPFPRRTSHSPDPPRRNYRSPTQPIEPNYRAKPNTLTRFQEQHGLDSPVDNPFPSPHGPNARISYPFPSSGGGSQKPLISYITNEWRKPKPSRRGRSYSDDEYDIERFKLEWKQYLRNRVFRRYVLLYAVMIVVCWVGWFRYLSPHLEETNLLKDSLRERMKNTKGWFGANQKVDFDGMHQIGVVDRRLVPGSEVPGVDGRRLIIIGDIHGCVDERMRTFSERPSFLFGK